MKPGDQSHVAVKGEHIGKSGKYGADVLVPFRTLTVDDVRPDFPQLAARRADATLIPRAEPADLGHMQAVKENISRQFCGGLHRALRARHDMHLNIRQLREAFQQGRRGCSEPWRFGFIFAIGLAIVGNQLGNFHGLSGPRVFISGINFEKLGWRIGRSNHPD